MHADISCELASVSNPYSFDFVKAHVIVGPVIEGPSLWRSNAGRALRDLDTAAIRQVIGYLRLGALACDLFDLLQVVPVMAAHGFHNCLQPHVAAFRMIHRPCQVRSA